MSPDRPATGPGTDAPLLRPDEVVDGVDGVDGVEDVGDLADVADVGDVTGDPGSTVVSARGLASPTRWMVAGRVFTQASRLVVP